MRRFASWITSHRAVVIVGWIVGLILIGIVASSAGSDFTEEFSLPSSDSKDALDLLENRFPAQAGDTVQIVYKAESGVESPAVKQKMEGVFAKVVALPHVSEVSSPYEEGGAAAVSDDGKIAYATAQFNVTTDKLNDGEVKKIMDAAQAAGGDGLQVETGGSPVEEVRGEEEESSSEGIGILAAVVVLLISFGSVVAMGLPLLTALFALGVGISAITLFTHVFNTAEFAPQLAFMIGLGVGVDYALFILTRFRNGLDEGLDKREAAVAAVDTAGRAVLFAGITVIISLMGMMLLGLPFLYGVAMAAAIAVLFTMIAALTLLPALLAIAGNWVNRLRLPFLGKGARSIDENSWWFRWSARIQRHPWIAALASGALLLALCIPTLSLRLGTNDAGTDPAGTTTREAYDLLAEGFGPGFNGPFVIVAALPEKGNAEALQDLRTQLKSEAGVEAVTDVSLNPNKTVGVFQLYPTTSPQSADTTDLLDHIRGDVIPPVEEATGAQVHVGGINAIFEDFGNAIAEKLPLFIGVVVLLSALLLMIVFRSLLVPLKAVLMNLLSIGAAFGLIVAVFQWGWGANLIGVDATGPIISFFPIFLFSIVFGLSMDYEVFLMSRIHEEWERTGDASEAVHRGLALTGRVITAAAAIMVTVFASFMIGDDRIIKLFGLGLASAVFIDAVIIRSVLVPAIMQLLGKRAWYFPGWLDRACPTLHVEPAEGDPSPTGEHPVVVAAGGGSDE
ncbi:MAG TPA: MMPL family transporter [Solirubrobacterales bacterium]|nr:MMPL family transporter [Solirubrobacterales bacterium]